MSQDSDRIVEQLTTQLRTIQEQLSKLTRRFDDLEHNLGEVSRLPAKICQLEDDLMLLGDRYRYQDLQKYLVDKNWFEADKETIRLILAVTSKEIEELTPEDIQRFPCNDLMVIDRLWLKYSDGRFGFSPQLKAYQELGGNFDTTIEQNQQLIETWGEGLGWRKDNRWLPCSELDFSLNAPIGCHPSR
ncbi:GUN4 domain-containing protein [Waterburya agarophytonicola K14]|uniref:GUN4 domain-containing protein n=1 Tax=Waterburya agarophytonicola KI4 TaxID=2874699 RepID=A0A964FHB0_9CYAN|nr:GUN4 domain-containing protein [Waterburya agarophytonicola]MCC0178976.1 GUN4 domain-containing protein [Waterburya agarophytonicola KI4]